MFPPASGECSAGKARVLFRKRPSKDDPDPNLIVPPYLRDDGKTIVLLIVEGMKFGYLLQGRQFLYCLPDGFDPRYWLGGTNIKTGKVFLQSIEKELYDSLKWNTEGFPDKYSRRKS